MKTLLRQAFAMLFVLCLCSVALAQTVPVPDEPPIPPLTGLAGLIVVLCMAASYAMRNYTPSASWAHTQWGAVVLAAASALIPAVTTWAQAGKLTLNTLTPLALGAFASLFAMSKPVGTNMKAAVKASVQKPATPPAPPSS